STLAVALLIFGFWFRPACLFIFLVLAVLLGIGFETRAAVGPLSHLVELTIVVVALFFIGPGKYSVDKG
ncbi:MAG: DoxX family protein, partial [Verrucomicrobiota bacterium]